MYFDEYYDIELDIDSFLNIVTDDDEQDKKSEDNYSLNHLVYELHSDIEELIMKSQRDESVNENREKTKRRKKCTNKEKLKKTIRFSTDTSPETEQVIRVDVTSNVSTKNDDGNRKLYNNNNNNNSLVSNFNKKRSTMINEPYVNGKSGHFKGNMVRCIADEEDFIVRCKQLAIESKNLDNF